MKNLFTRNNHIINSIENVLNKNCSTNAWKNRYNYIEVACECRTCRYGGI